MKLSKLSMAAAAAFASGVVMAVGAPEDATGFEEVNTYGASSVFTLQTGSSDKGDMADGILSGSHWFTPQMSEDTLVSEYGQAAKYEGVAFPETFNGVGDYFLKISNNTPLYRTFKSFGKVDDAWPTAFPAVPLDESASMGLDIGTALYIDTLVQFTPSEEAPEVVDNDHDKLIVYMNADGYLCVKARQLSGYTEEGDVTEFVTGKQLVANTWYRLTVKALKDIWIPDGISPHVPAFMIYIDGEQVSSATHTITDAFLAEADGEGAIDASVKALVEAGKLFTSIRSQTYGESRLEAVGFKGEGAIDDFVVSYNEPDFNGQTPTALDFTLTWDASVSAVWYTINDGTKTAAVSGVKVTNVPENATVKLEATPAAWYAIDEASVADLTVSAADTARTITASLKEFDLTITAGEGVASATPSVNKVKLGDTFTVDATADTWYTAPELDPDTAVGFSDNAGTFTVGGATEPEGAVSGTWKAAEAANGAAAGVTDTALGTWTPEQLKSAFGESVTPAAINAADEPYLDYQYGLSLGTLSAEPTLKITKIAEGESGWDVTVSVFNGSNALAIDDSEKLTLKAQLKVKSAATLDGLDEAIPASYDFTFDSTATDVVINVTEAEDCFFKATVNYVGAPELSE